MLNNAKTSKTGIQNITNNKTIEKLLLVSTKRLSNTEKLATDGLSLERISHAPVVARFFFNRAVSMNKKKKERKKERKRKARHGRLGWYAHPKHFISS